MAEQGIQAVENKAVDKIICRMQHWRKRMKEKGKLQHQGVHEQQQGIGCCLLFKDTDHRQVVLKIYFCKAKIIPEQARYYNLCTADLFSKPCHKFIPLVQVPQGGIPRKLSVG